MTRGDAVWLRRAIDNLIDNALAFAVAPLDGQPAIRIQLQVRGEQLLSMSATTAQGSTPASAGACSNASSPLAGTAAAVVWG
jgi:signal transduction histidine kinase